MLASSVKALNMFIFLSSSSWKVSPGRLFPKMSAWLIPPSDLILSNMSCAGLPSDTTASLL